jgi:hypothetical protein
MFVPRREIQLFFVGHSPPKLLISRLFKLAKQEHQIIAKFVCLNSTCFGTIVKIFPVDWIERCAMWIWKRRSDTFRFTVPRHDRNETWIAIAFRQFHTKFWFLVPLKCVNSAKRKSKNSGIEDFEENTKTTTRISWILIDNREAKRCFRDKLSSKFKFVSSYHQVT